MQACNLPFSVYVMMTRMTMMMLQLRLMPIFNFCAQCHLIFILCHLPCIVGRLGGNPRSHSPHHSGNLAPTITFLSPNSPSSYCYSAQKSFTRLAKKVKVNMNTFGPLGVSNQSIRSLPCRFGVMVRREAANM